MINEYCLKRLCKSRPELIENFKLAMEDETQTYDLHHRLETHFKNGKLREKQLSAKELKDRDLYFGRPSEELIFLTHSEHARLHHEGYSKSEKHKKNLSESMKGNSNAKGHKASAETRKKLSESHKGKNLSEETRKKLSESHKGKNRSEEARKKMSESQKGVNTWSKGRHLYNNGIITVMRFECPEGFWPGRA